MKIQTEISARHIHISEKDLIKLFGKNSKLTILKKISQPEQFAANETVKLKTKNATINARIIGPTREKTQIEISITDAIKLKIKPVIRISGNTEDAPKITIIGPKGKTTAPAIVAKRHLHLSEKDAIKLKLKNKQNIKIKVGKTREIIFNNVEVRTGKNHLTSFQIDTDEANAAGINKKAYAEIVK